MAGFRSAQARRHQGRLKRRSFRRGRFKITEVAAGFDVGKDSVWRAVRAGKIPHERVGRRIWLNSESVTAFMKLGYALRL